MRRSISRGRGARSTAVTLAIAASLASILPAQVAGAGDDDRRAPSPGAPGIGDPYFPLDGNGGYDVREYRLAITYDPVTDVLSGVATIDAKATQALSAFNLDLVGLTVRDVQVNARRATFSRAGGELTVVPSRSIAKDASFTTVVRYDGIPQPVIDELGISGFLATDDGALVVGQPDVAATWFPANDHPADAASFRFDITVPAGTEAIANGELTGQRTRQGWTTWSWNAREPMAPYLATATIGQFDIRSYRAGGIRYWDAVDPDLYINPFSPRSGTQVAYSGDAQGSSPSFKRLTRTISVPAEGGTLSFWALAATEPDWDFLFVEATGADGLPTTLPAPGVTNQSTGASCPDWLAVHPSLGAYQTDAGDGTCLPTGTTGAWHASSGVATVWTQWVVDLAAYAGNDVTVSISYASDPSVQLPGVAIDDIDVPGTVGDTGFEADGDTMDGWIVPGAPAGSPPNAADWAAVGQSGLPRSTGQIIDEAFARQPEIVSFLAGFFGEYPFRTAGGIVDDFEGLGFALENQTRPIYSKDFFGEPVGAASVIVHEYAHQWLGDDVRLARWQDIWLNEGFATYAEWLWAEREGQFTPQDVYDFYAGVPADDPFWSVVIGDPGPGSLFDSAVYNRGGLTVHALRAEVGDAAFFRILRTWADRRSGEAVTTAQFIDLAERISGRQLDALFDTWLYTDTKPAF